MKTLEQKREDDCYGQLCCWNHIQIRCPAYTECFVLAGGVRMVERVKAQNRKLRAIQDNPKEKENK
jgi:hypothetical protein